MFDLDNLLLNTVKNVSILFHTIEQAQVCKGLLLPVKNKQVAITKSSIAQEWSVLGHENSIELRRTSNLCTSLVPLQNHKSCCIKCRKQNLYTPSESCMKSDDESVIRKLFPAASDLMIKFLISQKIICNSSKDARSGRWDKELIQVALTLWNRSPQGYSSLKESNMLFLPSESLLQKYKKCFDQTPGLNDKMLTWMLKEAHQHQCDVNGGIILDEMRVQEDLKLSVN